MNDWLRVTAIGGDDYECRMTVRKADDTTITVTRPWITIGRTVGIGRPSSANGCPTCRKRSNHTTGWPNGSVTRMRNASTAGTA